MQRFAELEQATAAFLSASLVGGGWEDALEGIARSAGASSAVLIRERHLRVSASMTTPSYAEPMARHMKGLGPPNSRHVRVRTTLAGGFRADQDDYGLDELKRDVFYQEFMRPLGLFWHANAKLGGTETDFVEISLKFGIGSGPCRHELLHALDRQLANLRAAARVSQRLLEAEASGMVHVLELRGHPIFEINALGAILRAHGAPIEQLELPLRSNTRRLVAATAMAQQRIDEALARAIAGDRLPSLIRLDPSWFLQIVPVTGPARDVFGGAVALAILIAGRCEETTVWRRKTMLRQCFSLTVREADLACLLAEGDDLDQVAEYWGIGKGTARNHLKSVFTKLGVHRQSELAALVCRLTM